MNLLLLEPGEVSGADARIGGSRARHLLEVLKVAPGHEVRVGVVNGSHGTATVAAVDGPDVLLRCRFDAVGAPRPRVDLLLALPRPKVLRRLWAQLAALGVGRIILTNADRVERNYFDSHVLTPQCYRPLLIEGLQQARDTRLPEVSIHRQFKVLIQDDMDRLFDDGCRLVAHPGAQTPVAAVAGKPAGARVLLAVGPEGGWNEFEVKLLDAHGFERVSLGARTLRTDTACVALLALVHGALR